MVLIRTGCAEIPPPITTLFKSTIACMLKIKQAITGNGAASKEQVAEMLRRILSIPKENMPDFLDATDALGAALCHYYESSRPKPDKGCSSWKEFIAKNPSRVK